MAYRCPRCLSISHHPDDERERYCVACHSYGNELLAFRVFIDNEVLSEEWLGRWDHVEVTGQNQAGLIRRAEAAGLDWRFEIYDPESGETVRVSSKPDDLIEPMTIPLEDLPSVVQHRFGW
jgi:hypothetical protein